MNESMLNKCVRLLTRIISLFVSSFSSSSFFNLIQTPSADEACAHTYVLHCRLLMGKCVLCACVQGVCVCASRLGGAMCFFGLLISLTVRSFLQQQQCDGLKGRGSSRRQPGCHRDHPAGICDCPHCTHGCFTMHLLVLNEESVSTLG